MGVRAAGESATFSIGAHLELTLAQMGGETGLMCGSPAQQNEVLKADVGRGYRSETPTAQNRQWMPKSGFFRPPTLVTVTGTAVELNQPIRHELVSEFRRARAKRLGRILALFVPVVGLPLP
jgi:hypothetical protein